MIGERERAQRVGLGVRTELDVVVLAAGRRRHRCVLAIGAVVAVVADTVVIRRLSGDSIANAAVLARAVEAAARVLAHVSRVGRRTSAIVGRRARRCASAAILAWIHSADGGRRAAVGTVGSIVVGGTRARIAERVDERTGSAVQARIRVARIFFKIQDRVGLAALVGLE